MCVKKKKRKLHIHAIFVKCGSIRGRKKLNRSEINSIRQFVNINILCIPLSYIIYFWLLAFVLVPPRHFRLVWCCKNADLLYPRDLELSIRIGLIQYSVEYCKIVISSILEFHTN